MQVGPFPVRWGKPLRQNAGYVMVELKLFTFGLPRLERNGHPIDLNLRKALALLVYLAVTARPRAGNPLQH